MGGRATARATARAVTGAMITTLAAQVAHLQTQIDGLAELKAELDEVAQLKSELHHARAELDEVAQLKAELDHARSTEIPALKEHVLKLEAELHSSRVIPNNVTEATFDRGTQAYERAIEVLASNSHDHRDFQITALTEENKMVARFSLPFIKAVEVKGIGSQDD